jgi:3-hydroxypropionyl-CoA synthetase (ADP-forming)
MNHPIMVPEKYGFVTPRHGLAMSADEAANLAAQIGFPVVLKIVSPDIVHKTDVGGVELNLNSREEVKTAFAHILASVHDKAPEARVEGVRVEEMCREGVEIIIGLNNDPQFGPVVLFGLGGIWTEILRDVSFRVLPISRIDAQSMIEEIQGYNLLRGYRGRHPVSIEMLIGLLMKANSLGLDLADQLDSVDLNPIAVWEDQHRLLDAKILLRTERVPIANREPNVLHLDTFFKAGSVALIGASGTPGKIGNAVLDSLTRYEYKGKVYPVNPGRPELMGLKSYPSLSAIPSPVDLAISTVDLRQVPNVIKECAAQGVHNLVVVSGGGKELGGETAVVEAEIQRLARSLDVRVIGPNCIGVFDGQSRLDTFFQVQERMQRPRNGRVAMLTQSGTIGAAFLEDAVDLGISKFVSYGNRTDVDEADLLAYLAGDADTDVIALYVEGLGDGRKFLDTARRVSQIKPVVIFKGGRTERGARAAVSHTGFFGGLYEVVRGAFRQAGLIAVDSYEELFATAKALAMQPRAKGPRVAMISNGAGTMVQGIDLLKSYGLELANLSPTSLEKLKACYPSFYIVQNPIDVTGSATSTDYEIGIETLLQDSQVDMAMPWFVFQDTPLGEDIAQKLGRLTRTYGKPILAGAMGGPYTARMSRAVEAEGIPCLHSVRDWIAAARGLAFKQ